MVPVPGTKPCGPYSICHGPAGLGLVHDKSAVVEKGVTFKPVGVKHCWSTLTSSIIHLSPKPLFTSITKAK